MDVEMVMAAAQRWISFSDVMADATLSLFAASRVDLYRVSSRKLIGLTC
jgi:hypothetical protein